MFKKDPRKNMRQKMFINKRIQGKILVRAAAFWAIYHFLMLNTLFGFEFMQYQVEIMNGGNVKTFSELYTTFLSKYYPIFMAAFALLPILTADVIKMSHRIVGPLIPFQRAVKNLKEGKPVEKIKLREKDMLIEFQNDFNDFLDWYMKKQELENNKTEENSPTKANGEEQILSEIEELQKTVASSSEPAAAVQETAE